jgi:hypothetical protein
MLRLHQSGQMVLLVQTVKFLFLMALLSIGEQALLVPILMFSLMILVLLTVLVVLRLIKQHKPYTVKMPFLHNIFSLQINQET